MATYPKSYFGEITNRLAQLLGLDGRIPVKLSDTVTPVVIVGDGTIPGMAARSGKRWMARLQFNGTSTCSVVATAGQSGIIVDGWMVNTALLATTLSLRYMTQAEVIAAAASLIAPTPAQVMDSPSTDIPPLQIYAAAGALDVGTILNIPNTSGQIFRQDFSFYLSPGVGFGFVMSAGVGSGTVWGRIA